MTTKTDPDSHYKNEEIRKALCFEELYTDADLQKAFGQGAWGQMHTPHPDGTRGDIVHLEYKARFSALESAMEMLDRVANYLREQEQHGEDFQVTLQRRRLIDDIERVCKQCSFPLDHFDY